MNRGNYVFRGNLDSIFQAQSKGSGKWGFNSGWIFGCFMSNILVWPEIANLGWVGKLNEICPGSKSRNLERLSESGHEDREGRIGWVIPCCPGQKNSPHSPFLDAAKFYPKFGQPDSARVAPFSMKHLHAQAFHLETRSLLQVLDEFLANRFQTR